jgi:hypothetical protein
MKGAIEAVLAAPRFNMNALYGAVWSLIENDLAFAPALQVIEQILSEREYKRLANAILRNAFLIEPMLTRGGATKMTYRWLTALEGDQRYCSFGECLAIAENLINVLAGGWLDNPDYLETLQLSLNHQMISHESCFDYITLIERNDIVTRIHRIGNLGWIYSPTTIRTLKLRQFLTNPETSPDSVFFKKVLDDKIKIKAYLTDRVQTGEHQTNREKRWETHPHSVHFATRQMGIAIEYKLVTQICSFDGFPEASREALQAQNVLPEELEIFRCPVTLDPLSFTQFREELINPVHGRSSFQVAHLNPLKLGDPDEARGHMAENISWMSADGNRIQGSMSLTHIRALLRRIAGNYEELGLVEDTD